MGYIYKNLNPLGKHVDDCVIRAIALVTNKSWNDIYWDLSVEAFIAKDLINANSVWGRYLEKNGFNRHPLPDTCPVCYTVRDFVADHKYGIFVVGDGRHVVAVVDGYYIDISDCGDMSVLFFFEKEVIKDGY